MEKLFAGRDAILVYLRTDVLSSQHTLPLELDFAHEAEAMTSLRVALAHRDDVLVPTVIPDLSTARLLVMEYIHGIKVTDREALEQAP